MKNCILLAVLAAATSTPSLAAVPPFSPTPLQLDTVYNTGYLNGLKLTAPAADDHFSIRSAPIGDSIAGPTPIAAQVASPFPGGWYQATTTTPGQYISPVANQSYPPPPAEGDLPGFYDYQAVLPTAFADPAWLTVSGYYAADNTATVEVDGIPIATGPVPPTSQFSGLSYFTDTFEVGSGPVTTTFDFVVENYNADNSDPTMGSDGKLNPTGLFVTGLDVTDDELISTPEPSACLMMLGGLGALILVQRRRFARPF